MIKACLCRGLYNTLVSVLEGDGSAEMELGGKCLLAGPRERTPVPWLRGHAVALSFVLHPLGGITLALHYCYFMCLVLLNFFSDVTHRIARNGELLHYEFQLTKLPKKISLIVVNNGIEKPAYNSDSA